jgi:hypothetical protein
MGIYTNKRTITTYSSSYSPFEAAVIRLTNTHHTLEIMFIELHHFMSLDII